MHKLITIAGMTAIGVFSSVFLWSCGAKEEPAKATAVFDDLAYFAKVRTNKPAIKDTEQVDIDRLFAVMGNFDIEGLTTIYERAEFDPVLGATVVRDIKITGPHSYGPGLAIEKLTLWGLDSEALSDRIKGKRLSETLPIVTRAEARNVKVIGVESLFTYVDPFAEFPVEKKDTGDDEAGGYPGDIGERAALNSYDIGFKTIVVTELVLTPYQLNLKPIPEILKQGEAMDTDGLAQATEISQSYQKFGAFGHAVKFSDFAVYNGVYAMDLVTEGVGVSVDMRNHLIGYNDYDRGDLANSTVRGGTFSVALDITERIQTKLDFLNVDGIRFHGDFGSFTGAGYRMSKAMDHLARGVIPDRSLTDLMSMGVTSYSGLAMRVDDSDIYSLGKIELDLSEFHWLAPEVFSLKVDNASYHLTGILNLLRTFAGAALTGAVKAEDLQLVDDAIAVLQTHNLEAPKIDYDIIGHWDADTGKSDFTYGIGLDEVIDFSVLYRAKLPNFDQIMQAVASDYSSFDEDRFEKALNDHGVFEMAKIQITDEGTEGLYGAAVDLAQLIPDDGSNPGLKMIKNSTPEILRNTLANSVMFAAGPVSAEFPPGVAYLQSFSDFVGQGGIFTVIVNPKTPLDIKTLVALEAESEEDPDMEKLVELLGLQITHTPNK